MNKQNILNTPNFHLQLSNKEMDSSFDLVREWRDKYNSAHIFPCPDDSVLLLWIAHEQLQNTPATGKSLNEHLSSKSHCCCDTVLVCSIHDKYID